MKIQTGHSPSLLNWNETHGGPIYLSVGEHLSVNVTNYTEVENEDGTKTNKTVIIEKTVYQYSYSFIEYYYYQQPQIRKVEPLSGLT